ncbi:hypothetical protein MMC18_004241 [Xylographa bjoerkii]|nr:hypothetical protein [Xylographa bjoerkii]
MSPIISVKETGPPARRARKRQRRRGANSTEEKVSLVSGVGRLGKEGVDRPGARALPEDVVMTNNRFAALMSPATNAVPKAQSMKKETKIGPPARSSSQIDKNDIVLAPPQSAFTFSCSRPASATANGRDYAGSQRLTPVRVSEAGSPLPKVPTSTPGLCGTGKAQDKRVLVKSSVLVGKTSAGTESVKPAAESHTQKGAPHTQAQPATSMVTRDLSSIYTPAADDVPTGWPKPEPLILAPATKDRKSRFLPALSRMITSDSKSSTTSNEAATGETATEIVTSPINYTDALEHQLPISVVASKDASSRGSIDSGYGTKSGSAGTEASPTWNHSPSSEHEWEGSDVRFWMRE